MVSLLGNIIENIIVEPLEDAVDVTDGLLEGEIRTKPAARLVKDALIGVGISEVLDND